MISSRGCAAGQHVGVGHPRHDVVGVGLAPAVAGGRHAHQAGVLAVLHVADQDAVLDQHVAAGGRALVVDGERAAPLGHGAVVDHGDAGCGDALAQQAGEGRGALAVEVALEPVAHRLVQHHAGPAGAQHHGHLAGRCRHRLQPQPGLAQRLVGDAAPPARPRAAGRARSGRRRHARRSRAARRARPPR